MMLDRRTLAAGIAWTAPAVVFVASAPVMAASGPNAATVTVSGETTVTSNPGGGCSWTFNGADPTNDVAQPGILYVGASSGAAIIDVTVTVYLTLSGLSFTAESAFGAWTAPTPASEKDVGGVTYYGYKTTLADPDPVDIFDTGAGLLLNFSLTSTSSSSGCDVNASWFVTTSSTVDGTPITTQSAVNQWTQAQIVAAQGITLAAGSKSTAKAAASTAKRKWTLKKPFYS